MSKLDISGDWGVKLAEIKSLSDISPWRMAVVLETSDQSARIGFQPNRELGGAVSKQRETGLITLDGVRWARPTQGNFKGKTPNSVAQILQPGDVIYADPLYSKEGQPVEGQYRLRQIPEVSGAMVVMDPWTGRVLAMVGGFSFDQSQFNRATQAYRQPGSSFKPIVYSAALDNGYTPSTVVLDAPIEIDQGQGAGVWRPENFSVNKYQGPVTLRNALRQSLNTVTVRLAQDIGMPLIGEYARRFGVYDELPNYLSYALGAGETTAMRMVTAYSMLANGGRRVKPTLIDRIQDRYGHTIFKHDQRECRGCDAPGGWKNQAEPQLIDRREQVLDSMTAYQITELLEGVVQAGTATVVREVGKPIAGKTGTTNEAKDAWFVGFSPDVAVAIYMGYDKPRPLGKGNAATGGHLAAPIARDFLKLALADKPAVPFKVPAGIKLIRVVAKTGMRAGPGETGGTILEAFKPGTAPPDNYSVIGVADADGRGMPGPPQQAPDSGFFMRPGTGGLY
jgi:penicillin-binding protein 1A